MTRKRSRFSADFKRRVALEGLRERDTVQAIDHGDGGTAHAIRDRRVGDVDVRALDYGPDDRAGSVNRVCAAAMFKVDLEDICVSAIQTLVAHSAATGTSIPEDALGHLEYAYVQLKYGVWQTGHFRAGGYAPPGKNLCCQTMGRTAGR